MTTEQLLDPKPTVAALRAGVTMLFAVAEAIRKAGEIPSGHLYALLIERTDMRGYEAMIRTLKNAGLVEERLNLLKWIGPKLEASDAR